MEPNKASRYQTIYVIFFASTPQQRECYSVSPKGAIIICILYYSRLLCLLWYLFFLIDDKGGEIFSLMIIHIIHVTYTII